LFEFLEHTKFSNILLDTSSWQAYVRLKQMFEIFEQ